MKRLFTIITIAILSTISAFAIVDTNDIKIKGAVASKDYSFSLIYGGVALSDGTSISTVFDLSTVVNTGSFLIRRSAGNLNSDLSLTVNISAESFKSTYSETEIRDSGITPEVIFYSGYSNAVSTIIDSTSGKVDILIPAGPNKYVTDLSAFYFKISGSKNVIAGDYESKIIVTFTYG